MKIDEMMRIHMGVIDFVDASFIRYNVESSILVLPYIDIVIARKYETINIIFEIIII